MIEFDTLPWKKPRGVYADAGPKKAIEFSVANVAFQVKPIDKVGADTGRRRYFVACVDCDCILHNETTGPTSHITGHLHESHGFKGELGHVR